MPNEIIKRLEKVATQERKEKASACHPTAMRILGVTIPHLKVVYKSISGELKELEPRRLIELCVALVDTGILECRLFAYRALDDSKKALEELTAGDVEKLAGVLDNWGSVDHYGVLVAGYAWREGIISDQVIEGGAFRRFLDAAVGCCMHCLIESESPWGCW